VQPELPVQPVQVQLEQQVQLAAQAQPVLPVQPVQVQPVQLV
jgi:hypothetical protein